MVRAKKLLKKQENGPRVFDSRSLLEWLSLKNSRLAISEAADGYSAS
jgi:hypothetical protein